MLKSTSMLCPHCGSRTSIRTSRMVSATCKEFYLQCQNVECAHTFVSLMEAVRTIAPSQIPNPKVYLPNSPRKQTAMPDGQAELELDAT